MITRSYCSSVEEKHRVRRRLIPTVAMEDDGSPLVSLRDGASELVFEPSIVKGYRYLVRSAVFEKIARISKRLSAQRKSLFIRSAWRSFAHQQLLRDRYFGILRAKFPGKDSAQIGELVSNFIAPKGDSMHSTGGAVDALIYDLVDERIMDFGSNTGFEIKLDEQCYPLHPDIPPQARKNRALLMGLFESEDFVTDTSEFWHFDYGNVVWALEKSKTHAIYGVVGEWA